MLTATIIRLKKTGHIYVRVSPGDEPDASGDDVEILEILRGDSRQELKDRAEKYVREVVLGKKP